MTGRDLIIYILKYGLEDKRILDLITVEEAALKYNVGTATIKLWYKLNILSGIKLGDELYIINKGGLNNVE